MIYELEDGEIKPIADKCSNSRKSNEFLCMSHLKRILSKYKFSSIIPLNVFLLQ